DVFTQGVIQDQGRLSLWMAYPLGLLEQIGEPAVIHMLLKPRRVGEEARQIRFVGTLQYTAGNVGQAFVVQDDQARQVILEVVELASILKEIPKGVRVG